MTLAGILIPALLVAFALRRWFGPLPWSVITVSLALTLAFLGEAAFSSRKVPVPLDEVMRGYPWRGVTGVTESRNALTNDTVKQILPWMQAAREELRHGRAPLWNRYHFSGYPLLGNGQSAPFAPIFLATLFVPLPQQLVAMAGLKLFAALIFMWLFLRDEGVSMSAALFGSVLFAFSVFQTVYLYYPMTTVSSLLPAAAFAVRGCLRSDERRWRVLLTIVTAAVASGGHPESAVHIGIGCVVVMLLERAPLRAMTSAVLAAITGLAVSAPAWVPVVEQALRSIRAASLANAPHGALDPLIAWLLLNPNGFGNPALGNWQWIYNYSIAAPTYVGLIALALAFCARTRRDAALLVTSALLFLIAMNWTFVGRTFNALPPLSLIAQDRLRFVIVFLLAIPAARVAGTRFVLIPGIALLAAATWLLYAKWNVTLDRRSIGGVVALAAFLIVTIVRPRFAPAAAFALAAIELFAFNAGFNVPTSRAYFAPRMAILDRLRELAPREPFRITGHDWTLLPNAAAQYGFEDIRGHDPMALASYARFFDQLAAHDPASDVKRVQNTDHPALARLGVRFLLTDPSFSASDAWTLRYEGPDGKLYEAKQSMRRFFAPRNDAAIGTIVQESPARLRVEIDAPRGALIESSQVYVSGWRASGAELVKLDDTFLGLRVPPGKRTVTLTYRPLSFYGSCAVALLALAIAVLSLRARAANA